MWSLGRELRHHNDRTPKCKLEVTAPQFWGERLSFGSIFEGTREAGNLAVNRAPRIQTELTKRIDGGGDVPPAVVSAVIPCLNEAKSGTRCTLSAMRWRATSTKRRSRRNAATNAGAYRLSELCASLLRIR